MSKSVFLVVLASGVAHTVEADGFSAVVGGGAVFRSGGKDIALFREVDSVVKRLDLPAPPIAGSEPVSAVEGLAAFDPGPTISIDAININITVSGDITLCGVCRLGEAPCS